MKRKELLYRKMRELECHGTIVLFEAAKKQYPWFKWILVEA